MIIFFNPNFLNAKIIEGATPPEPKIKALLFSKFFPLFFIDKKNPPISVLSPTTLSFNKYNVFTEFASLA